MNIDFTLFTQWPVWLFVAAVLCAIISQCFPRIRVVLSFFTALFSVIGMVCAFILGATLQELLIPFLVLVMISLWLSGRRDGEEL